MPIDLSPAGEASPYPERGPRLLPWLAIWVAFCVAGAAIGLSLWPKGVPARGILFWWRIVGISNLAFVIVLGVARMGYEVQWYRAHHWNGHRRRWLGARVREAQRPLQVLGAGSCLPLPGHESLSGALQAGKPLIAEQSPRKGAGLIPHNRFEGESQSDVPVEGTLREKVPDLDAPVEPATETVATMVLKLVEALQPLAESLRALSRYGQRYAPAVHVLVGPEMAVLRLAQVQEALRRMDLPRLDCQPVPASDGLMVVDAWLDQQEWRPMLLVAAEWHDANPPVNSVEGCVAVLLDPGCFQLPAPVKVLGKLHRPLAGGISALGDLIANAVLWGNAEPATLQRAWVTRLGGEHDIALLAALKAAHLPQLGELEAQRRPDRVVGESGTMNPWLSIAAAIESRESGVHLVLDHTHAAVLHVLPSPHDESEQ